jgi:hypothetical protein
MKPRELVLRRRAKFIAAAAAVAGIACGKEKVEPPQPCLSVPMIRDAEPVPCLSPPPMDFDAGTPPEATDATPPIDAGKDAGKTTQKTKPAPMPCLSVVAPQTEPGKK